MRISFIEHFLFNFVVPCVRLYNNYIDESTRHKRHTKRSSTAVPATLQWSRRLPTLLLGLQRLLALFCILHTAKIHGTMKSRMMSHCRSPHSCSAYRHIPHCVLFPVNRRLCKHDCYLHPTCGSLLGWLQHRLSSVRQSSR